MSFGKQAQFITEYARNDSLRLVRGWRPTRTRADAKQPEFTHYRTAIIAGTVELGPKLAKPEEAALPPSAAEPKPAPDKTPC